MSKPVQPKKLHYYKHNIVHSVSDTSASCKIVYTPLYLNTQARKHLRKYWQAGTQKREIVTQLKVQPHGGNVHVSLTSIHGGTQYNCNHIHHHAMMHLADMEKRRVARELKGDVFVCPWKTYAHTGVLLPMSVCIGDHSRQLYSDTITQLQYAYCNLQHSSVACLVHSVVQHTFMQLQSVYTHAIPSIMHTRV